jgi:hypothetical protein
VEAGVMFEARDGDKTKSVGVRIFDQLPWMVRAYMYLLIIFLVTLVAMGLIDAFASKPIFATVIDRMLSFLGLIVGSVIGALSAAVKKEPSTRAKP